MMLTILRIGWLNLKRDRVVQALTFLLPVVFFSIFAGIFGGQGRDATSRVRVAVVDEDHSDVSRRLVRALGEEAGLRVRTTARLPGRREEATLDRERAIALVRDGDVPVAIVLPRGLGETFGRFDGSGPKIQLLADTSDPIAPQIVQGLLQKVAFTGTPDVVMGRGIDQFERYAGALTPDQRKAVDLWLPQLKDMRAGGPSRGTQGLAGYVDVEVVDVLHEGENTDVVAFYAAGTGVMFLLFMCSGAGGSLIEEVESGTLERLLSSSIGMNGLLAGKWALIGLVGSLQLVVMFVWGAIAFGLDLVSHLPGFIVMTLVTAASASAFGLVLATLCRTRAQLSGVSTIVILVMSAVGGSMFPRFLMSETMQKVGLVTFNAWALDGFVKVFWRDAALAELWPQLLVLTGLTVVFLATARLLARRWETV